MPIYEYSCEDCGARVEAIQRIDDEPLSVCEKCGGPLRRLLSAPAFQFKGSGWYVTDYARKGKAPPAEKEGSSSSSGSSETKSDTKGESKKSESSASSEKSA